VAEQLGALMRKRLPVIHIIGGGSKNRLLDQFTADATGRVVATGPVEATAIGNILVQAMAVGCIASLAEGRAIVRESFEVETFEPGDTAAWDEAYERYQSLKREKV
jgi:rhamnulokinase